MSITLSTRLSELAGLDARTRKALATGGFVTAERLLQHYPFRYEDRTRFDGWPLDGGGPAVCLLGEVTDTNVRRFGFRKSMVEVTLEPPDGLGLREAVVLRWFNMPFIQKSFAAGQQVIAYGKPKRAKGKKPRLVMDHPEHEILDEDPEEAALHLQRIVPIYHAREGVPQKALRRAMWQVLQGLDDSCIADVLRPASADSEFAGLNRAAALHHIHFPASTEQMETARRYLALEEFFGLQLNVLHRRRVWDALSGPGRTVSGELMQRWQKSLPFPLTGAQQRAIAEIRGDIASPRPMNRLLQGDVGSGKTFVAMAAMLLAVEGGAQAALMAPTQILAGQHYINFRKWLEPLGIRIALRTATQKEEAFLPLFDGGEQLPQMVIGTHALISGEDTGLTNPGLVVIDEQHKFGVDQRARLIRQGSAPDVLFMTATPIPRTLTMTVYGDLDVSILDELPAGRQPIVTAVREQPDMAQVTTFLKNQFSEGRQAYMVYPLIDQSDASKLKAATKEFEAWQKRLPQYRLGLLHGRMSADEKEAVMRDFRDGDIHALVSTTVIEVGVDVPNATVMIIFEAERFGIAQLHQLRGRIGRGEHKSYCVLVASGENPEAVERLKILETVSDGFEVAEEDLKLRGPGDILGTAQSGLPGLRLGDLVRDSRLVKLARRLAAEVLDKDPSLSRPEHARFRPLILSRGEMETLS